MANEIGAILKNCRVQAKISVKGISEILTKRGFKASESTIYSWENDNSQPTPGALFTMCDVYGVKNVLETFGYNGYNDDGSLQLNLSETDLIEVYRSLDQQGRDTVDYILKNEKARVDHLNEINKREPSNNTVKIYTHEEPVLNAAHDMGATEEEKQRADDIMMNDDEWK